MSHESFVEKNIIETAILGAESQLSRKKRFTAWVAGAGIILTAGVAAAEYLGRSESPCVSEQPVSTYSNKMVD